MWFLNSTLSRRFGSSRSCLEDQRQLFPLHLGENVTMQACHSDTCHRDYGMTKRGGNQLPFLKEKSQFHSVLALTSVEKAKSP